MKKIILAILLLNTLTFTAEIPSHLDERNILERALIKIKLKKDMSKNFQYSKETVYSRRSGGYRRIQGRIKNTSPDTFKWVTFKVMLGENSKNLDEVYRFTVHHFEGSKTYFLDSNVYVGDTKGKNMEIVYVDSKKRK